MQFLLASAGLIAAVVASTTQQELASCNPSNGNGIATVVNHCGESVWVDSTGHPSDGGMMELKSGASYCENLEGQPSIKLANRSTADLSTQILQFEYTLDTSSKKIWFDGSNVNCAIKNAALPSGWDMSQCPFTSFSIQGGSDPDAGNCKSVMCTAADQEPCADAYQNSDDDNQSMRDCPLGNSIKMVLCAAGVSNSTSGATSSPASSSAAATAKSTQSTQAASQSKAATSSTSLSSSKATTTSSPANAGAVTVTHIATAVQTTVVATHARRHEHRHPHWRI